MSKLSLLVCKLEEYKLRYETESYQPELNGLLIEAIVFLGFVGEQLDEIRTLLKEGK